MLNLFCLSSSLNEVFTQAQFCEDCSSGRSVVGCRVFQKNTTLDTNQPSSPSLCRAFKSRYFNRVLPITSRTSGQKGYVLVLGERLVKKREKNHIFFQLCQLFQKNFVPTSSFLHLLLPSSLPPFFQVRTVKFPENGRWAFVC